MIRVVNVSAANLRKLGLRPEDVCYVGRAGRFHKWPHHPLANPFKPTDIKYRHLMTDAEKIASCLDDYRGFLSGLTSQLLDGALKQLWADWQCDGGKRPLGCWCIDATHGDGQPVVCHAQILAAELHKRFVKEQA